MVTVKVLIEGYAMPLEKGWKASSTTCLIVTADKKIITDPGCNRQKLLAALDQESLVKDDIDYVFLSHHHPDHVLLAGIFEKAKYITFDSNLMFDNDVLLEFDRHVLGDDIEIIDTPGHVSEHLSLLVDTSEGKVAIAGDVIWWSDMQEQIVDPYQKELNQAVDMNMESLIKSRKKLLQMADYIIPGHGKKFKVKK